MKKCTRAVLLLLLLLSACNGEQEELAEHTIHVKDVGAVDVLVDHGGVEGIEHMERFYADVRSGVIADLRTAFYTTEGDPIVEDLHYDGELLEITNDSTRDKFGSREITTTTCRNLVEELTPTATVYFATDCVNHFSSMREILYIRHNVGQQDLFEFELRYGPSLEHIINSRQLTIAMKQQLYKSLVFANYLAEKEFKTACEIDALMNYHLHVQINGGQRTFEWNACDDSKDGVKFTKLANDLIEQSTIEPPAQVDMTIQGYVLQLKDNEILVGENFTLLDYEWLKDELSSIQFDDYALDFIVLEKVDVKGFNVGDKISATVEGDVIDGKPRRAIVQKIERE